MRALTILTLTIALSLLMTTFPGQAKEPPRDFVKIENITITPCGSNTSPEIAKFSGIWDGQHEGKSVRAHRLYVQEINNNEATVTVALGTSVGGGKKFKPSTWSKTAKIEQSKKGPVLKVGTPEGHVIRYWFTPDDDNKMEIEITLKFSGGHMVTVPGELKKLQ